ncbi:MAG: hypothetical protein ABL966_00960 [Acidimicrobiales bacterium]
MEGPGAPLGDLLDPVAGPLRDALAPVTDALADVFAQAVPQVDDLLAQAGVTLRILEPEDVVVESGAVTRASSGLSVELRYEGREQQALADLINSVPDELKPSLGPIPFPLAFFAENHIVGFDLAPAQVSSLASPPFDVDALPPLPDLPVDPGFADPGSGPFTPPAFDTPVPAVPAPSPAEDPLGSLEEVASPFDGALPAIHVLGVLLLSPLFGLGSTKLADNVLAPVSTSCPTGHDKPPARLP